MGRIAHGQGDRGSLPIIGKRRGEGLQRNLHLFVGLVRIFYSVKGYVLGLKVRLAHKDKAVGIDASLGIEDRELDDARGQLLHRYQDAVGRKYLEVLLHTVARDCQSQLLIGGCSMWV